MMIAQKVDDFWKIYPNSKRTFWDRPADVSAGLPKGRGCGKEEKIRNREISGKSPIFGIYKDGEIDFMVKSNLNDCRYGIEVKAGRSIGKSANLLLENGRVDYLYLLKGDTYGGIEGKKRTVPIYLAGRVKFDN